MSAVGEKEPKSPDKFTVEEFPEKTTDELIGALDNNSFFENELEELLNEPLE